MDGFGRGFDWSSPPLRFVLFRYAYYILARKVRRVNQWKRKDDGIVRVHRNRTLPSADFLRSLAVNSSRPASRIIGWFPGGHLFFSLFHWKRGVCVEGRIGVSSTVLLSVGWGFRLFVPPVGLPPVVEWTSVVSTRTAFEQVQLLSVANTFPFRGDASLVSPADTTLPV